MNKQTANVLWFDQLQRKDVNIVGGKSSSLGEMTSSMNVPVPYGFATTAKAYREFMDKSGVKAKVDELLNSIKDYEDADELHSVCTQIREIIVNAEMPDDIKRDIKLAYAQLADKIGQKNPFVAIRSSATA